MKFKLIVVLLLAILTVGTSPVFAADDGVSQKDIESIVKALKGLSISSEWYLSYQDGQSNNGTDYNKFVLKRGYVTIKKSITPYLTGRVTTDIYTNADGSTSPRLKYLYGEFKIQDMGFLTKPSVEVGLVHTPWLDFEEHINLFRAQDTMFVERNGLFNSADRGITFNTLFGGTMGTEYQNTVSKNYPGRYGSMAVGIYDGGGYHASESNQNKVIEGRLTIRPLPDVIPGLQISYLGITGKGNTAAEPDWRTNLGFVSYEQEYVTLTAQYYWGKGKSSGYDGIDDEGIGYVNDKKGYSFFTEIKPMDKYSIIGRYDHFDPNKNVSDDENDRYIVGLAYMLDKPHHNMILVDYDTVKYKQAGKEDDKRIQVTLQLEF